ncbi:MAG: Phosphoribosylformylglycinamidine (FGAM) synthase synthetase domain [Candidatus Methanohalarchaeum thermophilum]|uniref:Phosphoribosylformylglycinamidine synthase subunit PurL n=1 Tax=Methanohalarchaeum thermophilum TaxID=1903181 RepID=A0A1Q6DVX9_METT1|nr:MAG: Phosphoribosylformylglycinamidine (FGAM) synthase synthetase domain [Candidatus Methanohalarchaeum thermophilum]
MSLSNKDFKLIREELGREPSDVETELFINLWSEHCAYRSSKSILRQFNSEGPNVVIGPGDDAGVVELPNGVKLAIGIESHNHPSYVDPYNGAATGIGGIVRDIISMGARPIALADILRFGSLSKEKNQYIFEGVVEGISDYGNSIGVPTVTGEVEFDESYNGNPLVNVLCVGKVEDLITAKAKRSGDKLVLLGSSTGRDGLGGASFASEELDEDSEEEERSSVQIGDPFTEKQLIECILEMNEDNLLESCRDLGAAGLGGASSEMCSLGGYGAEINLDKIHTREEGMNAIELILSESQERMLIEVKEDNLGEIDQIAKKYDLDYSIIGEVTEDERYRADFEKKTVVDLPIDFLTEGAPLYHRKIEPSEPKQPILTSEKGEKSLKQKIDEILSSHNIGSKEWIYKQYDHEVQIRTILRPGEADSAVLRIEDNAIGISSGCLSKHCRRNPFMGGLGSLLTNAMNLATVGGLPLCLVDCLNFGSPEDKEVYWKFREVVNGINMGARALEVPVVGGNVSFYNDSEEYQQPVNPTPSIGMLGWISDSSNIPDFEIYAGQKLIRLRGKRRNYKKLEEDNDMDKVIEEKINLINLARDFVKEEDVSAARTVSRGGLIAALAKLVYSSKKGLKAEVKERDLGKEITRMGYAEAIFVSDHIPDKEEFNVIGEIDDSGKIEVVGENQDFSLGKNEINKKIEGLNKYMRGN